jgi:hypothetical protein
MQVEFLGAETLSRSFPCNGFFEQSFRMHCASESLGPIAEPTNSTPRSGLESISTELCLPSVLDLEVTSSRVFLKCYRHRSGFESNVPMSSQVFSTSRPRSFMQLSFLCLSSPRRSFESSFFVISSSTWLRVEFLLGLINTEGASSRFLQYCWLRSGLESSFL